MNRRLGKVLIGVLMVMMVWSGAVDAGGKLLGANVEVTDDGLTSLFDAEESDVATNGNVIYAVWADERDSDIVLPDAEIYLAKSTDGGATWGDNVSVSNGLDNEIGLRTPAAAVYPDDSVYVVWFNNHPREDGECPAGYEACIYMAYSEDGTDFDAWYLWASNDDMYHIVPQIAADPDSEDLLAVAVSDYVDSGAGKENVYGIVWDADVSEWRTQVINDQDGSAGTSSDWFDGSYMAVTARNGRVCMAWEDARDGDLRIYGDCTTDQGETWGADFAISPADVAASKPRLVLAGDGTLYAGYQVGEEVYVRSSKDNGTSWSTPVQATSVGDTLENYGWDMDVDENGTIVVLWGVGFSGSSDLYLSTSIGDGQTFTTIGPVEDDQGEYPAQASHYTLAVAAYGSGDDAQAVMVWNEDRNVDWEIWSARAMLDATPPSAPTNLQATPGDTVINLTWDAASDANGIHAYYVIRATQSGGPYSVLNPKPLTQTSYRDVGLDGTTYYYKVYAVDGTSNIGPASNEVSAAASVDTDLAVAGTLAYEVGEDIRLNDLPNPHNERVLTQGTQPLFAADGQRIYYFHNGAILSRAVDGSDPQTYYSDGDLYPGFDIARDDTGYFAWIEEANYSQFNPYAYWSTYEPHYGTAGNTQFVDAYEFASNPTISAERRWVAYTSLGYHAPYQLTDYGPVSLGIGDVRAGERVALYSDAHYWDPVFAPAGETLAFAASFSGQYEIWKATVGLGGALTHLTQLTRGAPGEWSLAPAWSSDGNWLVFARGAPGGEADPEAPALQNPQLYVVQSDGSSLRALRITGEAPTWHGTGSAPPVTYDHFVHLPLVMREH